MGNCALDSLRVAITSSTCRHTDLSLVPIDCGRDTARHVPDAGFQSIPGMGHDIPLALVDTLVERLAAHALAAETP